MAKYTFKVGKRERVLLPDGGIYTTDSDGKPDEQKYWWKNGFWVTETGRPAKAIEKHTTNLKRQLTNLKKKEREVKKNYADETPTANPPNISYKKAQELSEAKRFAVQISKRLEKIGLSDIIVAGSIRREEPIVGDIDMMAVGDITKVKSVKDFKYIKGGTKTVTFLYKDTQVNLYAYKPVFKGAMLLFLTGPGEYNTALRKIAKSKGWKLSQYGLFDEDKVLARKTEKAIYKKLGKEYTDPSKRGKKKPKSITKKIEWDTIWERLEKEDWKQFVRKQAVSTLLKIYVKLKDIYFNDPENSPVSDNVFDYIERTIEDKDPKARELGQTGAPPRRNEVDLPYYMPGLKKIENEKQLKVFKSKFDGPYIIMDKEDGLSIMTVKEDGLAAFSRGDTERGQDISHLLKFFKMPKKVPEGYAIRHEVIMDEKAFRKNYPKGKTARNTVGGLFTQKDPDPKLGKLVDLVSYAIVSPNMKPSDQLKKLKSFGFNVVPYKIMKTLDYYELLDYLNERKRKSKYALDGLVIVQDKKSPNKATEPANARKFKVNVEADTKVVPVEKVEWRESKNGLLKPRVHIKPTQVGQVTVTHFSGFNAFFITTGYRKREAIGKKKPIGPGAMIKVVHSGGVIPHIMEVIKGVKEPQMPEIDYEWNSSGTDIKVSTLNSNVDIKRLTHFFRTLGVKEISIGVITKLYSAGFDEIAKIITAKTSDIANIPGLGKKSAKTIQSEIKNALIDVPMAKLMAASGAFSGLIGERRIQDVLSKIPDVLERKDNKLVKEIASLKGWKKTTATAFVDGLSPFRKFYNKIKKYVKLMEVQTGNMVGETIVFTGFRDKSLELQIQKEGGTVKNSITKDVTILVCKDRNSGSSKIDKALDRGIKVLTKQEFLKKIR